VQVVGVAAEPAWHTWTTAATACCPSEPAAGGLRALEGGARPCEVRLAQFLVLTIRIEHNSHVIVYLWASALKRGEQRHCRTAIASAAQPQPRQPSGSPRIYLSVVIFSAVILSTDLGLIT